MSGLAVRYHRDGRRVEPRLIWSMLEAIPYQALDGMWVHSEETLALGYAKLTITPEEVEEAQPLVSPRTGCTVIADVRLDNREELLARLPGSLSVTVSDATLILHAYETWGTAAIERLLGDFAVVIWDPRHQRLICARDTSGQRGLFYYLDDATFTAASEIHQLFQDPAIPVEPNDDQILAGLLPQSVFSNEKQTHGTYYQDIYAVPAGQILVLNPDESRLVPYLELAPREIRYKRDSEYAEHFRELLSKAVASRLRSSYPVGIMLSGGLDSSSIVATAQQLYRQGAVTSHGFISFSFAFDGLDCDEQPYIEELQQMYGFEARYVQPGFGGRLEREPQGFRESPNVGVREGRDALFGDAQRAGVRTLLSGQVADACINGSPLVFDSLIRNRKLRQLQHGMRTYHRSTDASWKKIIGLFGIAPLLPLPVQRSIMTRHMQRGLQRFESRLLPIWIPEPLRSGLTERSVALSIATERERTYQNQTREWEFGMLYPPEIARYPSPWSFQMSRPYADRRLHAFLLGIPPEYKYVPNASDNYYAGAKQLVRQGLADLLPHSIAARTSKTTFGDVHTSEVEQSWLHFERTFGPGSSSQVAARGYIDPTQFWNRLLEIRDGSQGRDMMYVMHIAQLETWLRSVTLPREQLVTADALQVPAGAVFH